MARPASLEVGGYYPTPSSMVAKIASLFTRSPGQVIVVDPCAGEGEAIFGFSNILMQGREDREEAVVYAVEMEKSRYELLRSNSYSSRSNGIRTGEFAHGDAFHLTWDKHDDAEAGAGLLWLNPPYDTDPILGRLEEKFLVRFTNTLAIGGYLVFIVPFYALKASASTLSTNYTDLHCFRFPEPEWGAYKQVVLIAKRTTASMLPDSNNLEIVNKWSSDSDSISILSDQVGLFNIQGVPSSYSYGFSRWVIQPVDVQGILSKFKPWHQSDRAGKTSLVSGVIPNDSILNLMTRNYPLAMPPRPAHIAAGIAAGIFNGSKIDPDQSGSSLPPLLVKGVFDKEFRTVEEKKNKDGEVTSLVQVQQPKLVTTVLDLSTSKYHTIQASAEKTKSEDLSSMTMADLLQHYGRGLMEVMLQQCPVLHDPSKEEHNFPLPNLARKLYRAQETAVRGAIKLLGGLDCRKKDRSGKAAFILGEIGSGKTSCSIATAEAIKTKRNLVMCPPHLLQSWRDQISQVAPWAKVVTLSDVTEVDALAANNSNEVIYALLSREVAKLGHSFESVVNHCPKCGFELDAEVDYSKKREVCTHKRLIAKGGNAKLLVHLARNILPVLPHQVKVTQYLRGRHDLKRIEIYKKRYQVDPAKYLKEMWGTFDTSEVKKVVEKLTEVIKSQLDDSVTRTHETECLISLLAALGDEALLVKIAEKLYRASVEYENSTGTQYSYGPPHTLRDVALSILMLLKVTDENKEAIQGVASLREESGYGGPFTTFQSKRNISTPSYDWKWREYQVSAELVTYKEHKVGSVEHLVLALESLRQASTFSFSLECGEHLYQSIPEPRRYPLAKYIAKKYPKLFDLFILDECHESSNAGSAQSLAAHRITALGVPSLLMTGSVMNGYAESLFTNMWAVSPKFREEFSRDETQKFVDRYGYRKRTVEDKSKETGKVIEYGSMSDRVERVEKLTGNAPGVLPLFLLKHLLAMSVTLHKSDLALDIPKCTEYRVEVEPSKELKSQYDYLKSVLLETIKKDRFKEDLAGKLWGAMAELPSYLDRATSDVGNNDQGTYEITYPKSVGGDVVCSAGVISADEVLPKEQWLIDKIKEELAEGRNVMVFGWHTNLLPRLAKLIETYTGEKCPILNPDKVSTGKRQDWIEKEIVKKKRRVMVVNPVAVQTGLNNLVHFHTEVWYQNPACNPITYRQALGRVDRIGQKKETRIFFPTYRDTLQTALFELLMHKVAVSIQTDGLDPASALEAAGVGVDGSYTGFSVGKFLYDLLTQET